MSKRQLSRADLAGLGKERARLHGALFFLSAFELPKGQEARFTCVISKKIAPSAVQRNTVRRRCREAARARVQELHIPLALVFRAKKGARGAVFADIRREVFSLIEKVADTRYNTHQ